MKHIDVDGYDVSGFPVAGGWRLDVHHNTWPAEQSYWYVGGMFYQCQTMLEPNVVNEIVLSERVPVSPESGAEQAMYKAVIEWQTEEPKSGLA